MKIVKFIEESFWLPFIIAVIFGLLMARKINRKFINSTMSYYNFISIIVICFLLYIAIANQSSEILNNPIGTILNTLWLYTFFIFSHIAGYFAVFWRKKEDKIALLVALSEIPWSTTLGPFKYFLKKLK